MELDLTFSAMALSLWDAFLYGFGLLIVIYFFTKYIKQTGLPLPPGPPKWPVLGNLLDFPSNAEWETFERWGKEYSEGVSIHQWACSDASSS